MFYFIISGVYSSSKNLQITLFTFQLHVESLLNKEKHVRGSSSNFRNKRLVDHETKSKRPHK